MKAKVIAVCCMWGFILGFIACFLGGCQTLGIAPETQAKLCADAKTGIADAEAALAVVGISDPQRADWTNYLSGAKAVYSANCGVK